jgi:hypothetical protein
VRAAHTLGVLHIGASRRRGGQRSGRGEGLEVQIVEGQAEFRLGDVQRLAQQATVA